MNINTKAMIPVQKVPDIQHTVPEVFIFESLDEDDEDTSRLEGRMLTDMLRLAGKNPKYYYFQSESELPHLFGLFRESKYRFLHVSSHGSNSSIGLTHGDISYEQFADYSEGHLKLRRLFFSACHVGNQDFVDAITAKNKGMHSIMSPTAAIDFDHAAALWCAFYVSIFAADINAMKHADIEKRAKALTKLFPIDLFLSTYNPKCDKWNSRTIKNR